MYICKASSHAILKTSSLDLRHFRSRFREVCLRALVLSLNHGVMFRDVRFLVFKGAMESIVTSKASLKPFVKLSREPE